MQLPLFEPFQEHAAVLSTSTSGAPGSFEAGTVLADPVRAAPQMLRLLEDQDAWRALPHARNIPWCASRTIHMSTNDTETAQTVPLHLAPRVRLEPRVAATGITSSPTVRVGCRSSFRACVQAVDWQTGGAMFLSMARPSHGGE